MDRGASPASKGQGASADASSSAFPHAEIERLRKAAYLAARRCGLCAADAEDVAQYTILEWWKVSSQVTLPLGWARVVAHRKSAHLTHKVQRWIFTDEPTLESWVALGACSALAPSGLEQRIDLKRAFDKLPDELWVAWAGRKVESLSLEEQVEATGVSRSTLLRRVKLGARRLRAAVV
jgi:DNA-directed RNA polymerase specialized sigma24 family protein